MEWDIIEIIERACTIKTRVVGYRDFNLLYIAHQFLIEVTLDENLLKFLQVLVTWIGV